MLEFGKSIILTDIKQETARLNEKKKLYICNKYVTLATVCA